MNRARQRAAASQVAAKLGERGAVERVGNGCRGEAPGELRAVVADGPNRHGAVHRWRERSARAMLGANVAPELRGLRRGALRAMRMRTRRMTIPGMRRDRHVFMAGGTETDGHGGHRAQGHERHKEQNRERFQQAAHRMHYDTGLDA